MRKNKKYELPELEVPEKYQPYEDVSREIKEVGVPLGCTIVFAISIIFMIIIFVGEIL